MTTPPRDLATLLDALNAVAPAIIEAAPAADRETRLPPHIADAIARAGLYRPWIPRTHGGDELPLPDSLRYFEAASQLDGATGWLITIGTGGGLFGAHMQPTAAREVFTPIRALIAGSGSPTGTAATPVEGGYRVSGQWMYASGAHHATWFTANCVIRDGHQDTDTPTIRAVALPPEAVEVIDTWHVTGMRATSSHDIRVQDQFVPEHRLFNVFGEPREPGPLYRFPFASIAELSFASVALGIAAHALAVFPEDLSPSRARGQDTTTLLETAHAELDRVRSVFHHHAAEAWAITTAASPTAGAPLDDSQRTAIHTTAVEATRTAAHLVHQLYLAAGMAPLYPHSTLGRCWRDIHTVTQHIALAPAG